MAPPTRILIFGDQTVDSSSTVKHLITQSRHSAILKTFLQRATDVFQSEIAKLDHHERARFKSFHSLQSLTEFSHDHLNVVVTTVSLCIAQLGTYILHSEHDPELLEHGCPPNIRIIGLCTGLLAAAAAATATSSDSLIRISTEMVRVATLLALEADGRSKDIEDSKQSWATVVSTNASELDHHTLRDFHRETGLPAHKHAYVSAVTDSSTTLSGPPSTLAHLFRWSPILTNASKASLPISAAFHAPHLAPPDLAKITSSLWSLDKELRDNVHVISTKSGSFYTATTMISLLHEIAKDIFQSRLDFGKVLSNAVADIDKASDLTIMSVGPTNAQKSVRRALNAMGLNALELEPAIPSQLLDVRSGSGDIAIVGMSCRTPGAESLEEFWDVLERGRDLCTKVPEGRFSLNGRKNSSSTAKHAAPTPYGCFLDHPGLFDASIFNMSPREAAQTDPTQRLIMLTAYEALEMAGYSHEFNLANGRVGTFFGQTTDDWREHNISNHPDLYYVSGGLRPFGPGRLNYHFKWEGPSYSLDAACSSSSVSVQMAVNALLSRDCDTALAGGGNIITGSTMTAGLTRGSFLSPTGSCKTFDETADGYCRGEGVGTVVLKRVEDAIANRDNILGVIKAVATNHSAYASSITHPHAGAQQRLYRRVLNDAATDPEQIDYIEMHGTGTTAGDTTEVDSVTKVFGQSRRPDHPLYIGSVKPNVGHGEAVAGVESLIKVLLMLQQNTVPPHCGIKTRLNPSLPDLAAMNIRIAESSRPFEAHSRGNRKRRILLNNFNATGGNTSLIIEDAPPKAVVESDDPRSAHVVAMSARTLSSLRSNKQRMLDFLKAYPQVKLADIAYTTTARRNHHVYRTTFSAQTTAELTTQLDNDVRSMIDPSRLDGEAPVAFFFTGQGSQYAGMGIGLFKTCSAFRQQILQFDSICGQLGFPSFVDIISDTHVDMRTISPVQVQLSIVSVDLALAFLWRSWGVSPTVVVGHSLGEYAALCFAGVLSLVDMFLLIGKRALLMQERCTASTHAMLAVQCPPDTVLGLEPSAYDVKNCTISCLNGPNATVVSGAVADIKDMKTIMEGRGIKSTLLEVPYAFHSHQVEPILEDFHAVAETVKYSSPTIPVASTLRGDIVRDEGVFSADYLIHQARDPVNFVSAVENCRKEGLIQDKALLLECGPSPVCVGMAQSVLSASPAQSLPSMSSNDKTCWKTLTKSVANAFARGVPVMWSDYHRSFESHLSLIDLPRYAFDLKDCWTKSESCSHTPADGISQSAHGVTEPTLLTTCLHRIETKEVSAGGNVSVTFVSDVSEPGLFAAIQGHMVDGVGLCPSSVYADMAFTAAAYIHSDTQQSVPDSGVPAMKLSHMEVFHPLVVPPSAAQGISQKIRVAAHQETATSCVRVSFSSFEGGKEPQEHGNCTVSFPSSEKSQSEWSRNSYLITNRIETLTSAAKEGRIDHLLRPLIYRLFSRIVLYTEKYHGLQEVYMDNNLGEVAAKVKFQNVDDVGKFTFSPYWIDTIAHLAGFVLNGATNNPDDTVFISHGWKDMRIIAPLSSEKSYMSHVRMQSINNNGLMCGDVHVLEGDEVVAVCRGIKFQKMKRNILFMLLRRCHSDDTATSGQPSLGVSPSQTKHKDSASRKPQSHSIGAPKPPAVQQAPLFDQVLSTIAEEVGVDASELTDTTDFAQIGVDSLLSISIGSSLKQKLGADLPASLFAMYPTVGELRQYFIDETGEQSSDIPLSANTDSNTALAEDDSTLTDSATSTDRLSVSSRSSVPTPKVDDSKLGCIADVLLEAVASETGLPPSDLVDSARFQDLGVESLLTISILGIVKDRAGAMLPASFFNDFPTVGEARRELGGGAEEKAPMAMVATSRALSPAPAVKVNGTSSPGRYTTHSVFIQGRQRSSHPPLFLIADGAGSAASYVNLPPFKSGLPVYALESPFLKCPTEHGACSFEEVSTIYADYIQAAHPSGPVILGGWSMGGMYAFEVARQLITRNRTVQGLIMIDSPCPRPLPHMPEPTLELMESTGIFIGIKRAGQAKESPMPLDTKLHLLECVKALRVYDPVPIPAALAPKHKFLIWAKQGTFEKMGEKVAEAAEIEQAKDEAEGEKVGLSKDWLSSKRTSFGPNGWDRLIGDGIECVAIDGDHFSVMNVPKIKHTGHLINEALERFLG